MYSYLRDNGVCDHCLTTKDQEEFAFYATWIGRALVPSALALSLLFAWGTHCATQAQHPSESILWSFSVGFSVWAAIELVQFIRYALIGRDLYIFLDSRQQAHCERSYPVSIEPGHPRAPESLAAGPVLRLRSRLFVRSGIVNAHGVLQWRSRRAVVIRTPEGGSPGLRVLSNAVRIDGPTVQSTLQLLDAAILSNPESLAERVVNHQALVEMLGAKVEECNALSETLASTKMELTGAYLLHDNLAADYDVERTTAAYRKKQLDAIAEELLTLAARIAHFRDRRCSESHPGAIRLELERILDARYTRSELFEAGARLIIAGSPFAHALKDLGFIPAAGKETPAATDAPNPPAEPDSPERPADPPKKAGENEYAPFWTSNN